MMSLFPRFFESRLLVKGGVLVVGMLLSVGLAACEQAGSDAETDSICAADDGGLELADGFCATVVADDLGPTRHLAVADNGDVYATLSEETQGGSIVALRDTGGDYTADEVEYFAESGGTGMGLHNGHVYLGTTDEVWRFERGDDELVPSGEPELVVTDFPEQESHEAKSLSFDNDGNMYVNVGAPSNACMEESRTQGSPGQDPCPELERHAGIWQFEADQLDQTQVEDGSRYATGIRNAVAHTWNDDAGSLYLAQHGRDQLAQFYPDLYTEKEGAELPAEEFFQVDEGDNFGWPYCYYDWMQEQKVQAPEYGGDGKEVGRCDQFEDPIQAFPGHWAPNDVLFYTGNQFPDKFQGGAFIAWHGSWNRAPLPQEGYKVTFTPFDGDMPAGEYEVFADGFAGTDTIESSGDAEYRPTGLAVGPDGGLYVSDDEQGRIWRITHTSALEN